MTTKQRSTEESRFSAFARWQHGLMAALIVLTIAVGAYMENILPLSDRFRAYALHKSLGITVLALLLIRVAWRLRAKPKLPAELQGWQLYAARVSHGLLYLLMLIVPVSGWLMNSAANFPLQWFGLVNLPALVARNPALKSTFATVHSWLAWTLTAVIVIHLLAALKHHFVDRNNILSNMFWTRPEP
jgi:cytochrome b561